MRTANYFVIDFAGLKITALNPPIIKVLQNEIKLTFFDFTYVVLITCPWKPVEIGTRLMAYRWDG